MEKLLNSPVIKIFFVGIIALIAYILFFVPVQLGGDIVEYHGITESLIKSQTIKLTAVVEYNINTYLSPEYLKDPGYYIEGRNGDRYPVHFLLYSLLSLPIRLLLKLFELNELLALRITNLVILSITLFYIMKKFLTTEKQRFLLLFLTFTSPLVTFIIWPGPDLYYLSLMLLSMFLFFDRSYIKSIIVMALASLHSQPLIVLTLALIGYYLFQYISIHKTEKGHALQLVFRPILVASTALTIAAIPYIYNLFIFGKLSPWTILEDGWTRLNGFGIHNASLQKFIEQFFDLNFGLFWFAPLTLILGTIGIIMKAKGIEKNKVLFLVSATLLTAFFYQTNPAWHYGTSGYGPSRHAIFLLPMFIYFALQFFHLKSRLVIVFVALLSIWQIGILSTNGYFAPKLENTLKHSKYAEIALNLNPSIYNPTPEIFVDRTNHQDIQHPTSAIYKLNGVCKKAYILKTDKTYLENQCGPVSSKNSDFFDDEFDRKANFTRTVTTNQVTFWPDPASCGKDYVTSDTTPYVCMRTLDDVMKQTGVNDSKRFSKVKEFDYPGVWRLTEGSIITVNIPPGYVIDYSSFDGKYINY